MRDSSTTNFMSMAPDPMTKWFLAHLQGCVPPWCFSHPCEWGPSFYTKLCLVGSLLIVAPTVKTLSTTSHIWHGKTDLLYLLLPLLKQELEEFDVGAKSTQTQVLYLLLVILVTYAVSLNLNFLTSIMKITILVSTSQGWCGKTWENVCEEPTPVTSTRNHSRYAASSMHSQADPADSGVHPSWWKMQHSPWLPCT